MLAKCCASGRQRRVLHDDRTRPLRALRHYGGKHARRARVPRPVRARMHHAPRCKHALPRACAPHATQGWPRPHRRARACPHRRARACAPAMCARADASSRSLRPMRIGGELDAVVSAAASETLGAPFGPQALRSGTLSVRSAPPLVAIATLSATASHPQPLSPAGVRE